MSAFNLRIITFNCARTLIDVSSFALLVLDPLFRTSSVPDIVVLSLQEIAPISQSFLGGSYIAPYFGAFVDALTITAQTQGGHAYENIVTKNLGMTALMVFAKVDIVDRIRAIETAGVGVGLWEMGNKGAVGARIRWVGDREDDTYTTFIAAHLAPMEDAVQRRNEDWKHIVQNLVFIPERATPTSERTDRAASHEEQRPLLSRPHSPNTQFTLYSSPSSISYLFLAGDLNYRTSDSAPAQDAYKIWPQPTSDRNSPRHFSHYLSSDQLTREKGAGRTLHHLVEAPIDFPPTYKYEQPSNSSIDFSDSNNDRRENDGAASIVPNDLQAAKNVRFSKDPYATETWVWAKHRTPSWCDRILFLPSPKLETQSYTALPLLSSSDHRPVALAASISSSEESETSTWDHIRDAPFLVNPQWRKKRDAARRRELAAGLTLYLATTNEGRMIALAVGVGIFAGVLALRRYLGS